MNTDAHAHCKANKVFIGMIYRYRNSNILPVIPATRATRKNTWCSINLPARLVLVVNIFGVGSVNHALWTTRCLQAKNQSTMPGDHNLCCHFPELCYLPDIAILSLKSEISPSVRKFGILGILLHH